MKAELDGALLLLDSDMDFSEQEHMRRGGQTGAVGVLSHDVTESSLWRSLSRGQCIYSSKQSNGVSEPGWLLWCYCWSGERYSFSILCHKGDGASSSMQLHMQSTRSKEEPKRL